MRLDERRRLVCGPWRFCLGFVQARIGPNQPDQERLAVLAVTSACDTITALPPKLPTAISLRPWSWRTTWASSISWRMPNSSGQVSPLLPSCANSLTPPIELEDILELPKDEAHTLSLLDATLKRSLVLCAAYHGLFSGSCF